MGFQESALESRCFSKPQWSHGFLGKYSGVLRFQESTVGLRGFRKVQLRRGVLENTVESWGFRKTQRSHGVSGKHS